jgi:hypothetical protein
MVTTDADVRTAMKMGLDAPVSPRALELIKYIQESFGTSTAAIIHYGSRAQKSGSRADSAYDFFVIVDDYEAAFLSFASSAHPRFSARTAVSLSRFLPPSIVALTHLPANAEEHNQAKCAVLSLKDLAIVSASDSPDHFAKGRLFQQLQLAFTRDSAAREAVEDAIIAARLSTFEWGSPYLPARFSAEDYCRRLLETSYAGEIRVETQARIHELLAAQGSTLYAMYDQLLASLAEEGTLRRVNGRYEQVNPPSAARKAKVDSYFRRSKARATMRWVKLIWLYDDWLEYLNQKLGRRANHVIDLTPQERRWPFLLLWPKLFRYIASRR